MPVTPVAIAEPSLTLLEQVFWHSPAFMVVLSGPDFVVELANPSYLRMVDRETLVGERIFDVLPEAGDEGYRALLQGVLATGEPASGREVPFTLRRGADGTAEQRMVDFNYLPMPDASGTISRVFVHGLDVTEHVAARERAAREKQELLEKLAFDRERLRTLIRVMPIPVALHSGPEHRFEICSEAFREVSGGRDLTGLTPSEAYPEIVGHGILEKFDEVVRTGKPWISPETHARFNRRGEGIEDTWFNIRYEPVRDAQGTIVGVLNVSFDITEDVRTRREALAMNGELQRQQLESERMNADLHEVAIELAVRSLEAEDARRDVERLLDDSERARAEAEAARREAETANRGKAEFLAAMSHELRTPLNAIGGYAELLEMGIRGPTTAAQLEDLQRIKLSQRHLLRLVNEILNYARIETGSVRYDVEDVPLSPLVISLEPLIAPQIASKALRFEHDDCGTTELIIRADREKTRQVLLNLLSNAIKFTARGGVVKVACAAEDDAVLVEVCDSGIGIAPLEQERVFEPFVQVDASLTRAHEGAGLGLAISRDLARGMGGDLTVRSSPGEGSTFTLRLPRAPHRMPTDETS